MNDRDTIYIDGAWVAPVDGGEPIEVVDPTTEAALATVPAAGPGDVDRAAGAAARAFPAWSATPAKDRAELLRAVSSGLQARADDIADTIASEVGTPRKLALRIQAALPVASFATAADLAPLADEVIEQGNSLVVSEAAGVVGAITPWNYPLHQIAAKVAYALAAGCTVVLKPSEVAPLNAFLLVEVLHDAGVPAGVVNVVTGTGPIVGEAIAAHERIDMVSFTGSTRAGVRVAELAAPTVKRVALELGGKSANILLDDLDDATFERAVKSGVGDCFLNSGQTCSALTRMLVPRGRLAQAEQLAACTADAFTLGDPFDPATKLGPLVSAAQRDRARDYIERGLAEGARLVAGGPEPPDGLASGFFVRPTVLSAVRPDMVVAREEIFAPVLCVLAHDGDDDAVAIANDSDYGLAGGVWSGDAGRGLSVARWLRTGQVQLNGGAFNPAAPFGGFKRSGVGREFGRHGLGEFLETKSIQR